ncbi:hypothetical protein [Brevibacterium epidermidis]|uniref:hypothetical protein n=1 Tax=Brevibacterium epidermidis TaxID=1698 RepID=UPI000BF685AB|nr:hypothetical protein [Brevibacterium epidermidis]
MQTRQNDETVTPMSTTNRLGEGNRMTSGRLGEVMIRHCTINSTPHHYLGGHPSPRTAQRFTTSGGQE